MHIKLLGNIERYLAIKREKMIDEQERALSVAPYNYMNGICSGLVAYWLYSKKLNRNLVFDKAYAHDFEHVLNWSPEEFTASPALTDPDMEQFINAAMFLQYDTLLRSDVKQNDMHKSFALLSSEFELDEPELRTTFVFDRSTLVDFLSKIVHDKKMIKITNGFHAVGLFKQNHNFSYFDPTDLPVEYNDIEQVAGAIFDSLLRSETNNYLAIHFNCFDIKPSTNPVYPDLNKYYIEVLAHEDYKRAAFSHYNFFHLAASCNDYKAMDLMFKLGYQYVPWTYTVDEITEAIISDNTSLLKYLLVHNFLPNQYNANSETPMQNAIDRNSLQMVCMLLAYGADPNAKVSNGYDTLRYAISIKHQDKIHQSTKANIIAVLIGGGAHATHNHIRLLNTHFSTSEITSIKTNASKIKQLVQAREVHIKDLDSITRYVKSKPIADHSVNDLQELVKVFVSLNVICEAPLSPLHPMHAYITLHARYTRFFLNKYLFDNNVQDLSTYLKQRAPQLMLSGLNLHVHNFVDVLDPDILYTNVCRITNSF